MKRGRGCSADRCGGVYVVDKERGVGRTLCGASFTEKGGQVINMRRYLHMHKMSLEG